MVLSQRVISSGFSFASVLESYFSINNDRFFIVYILIILILLILSSGLEVSKPISQPLLSFLTGFFRALDLKVRAAGRVGGSGIISLLSK
jgi:hypothetical protein